MSSDDERDTFSQGVQTMPPQAAQAVNLARSAGSYHYETIRFDIRREPVFDGGLMEVIDVSRRTRIPGCEYTDDNDVDSYFLGRERVVREVMPSRHRRLEPPKGNPKHQIYTAAAAPPSIMQTVYPLSAAAITSTPRFTTNGAEASASALPTTAEPGAPAASKASAGTQTGAASAAETGLFEFDDDIQYIKTVYPTKPSNDAGRATGRIRRAPLPTRQLKMYDFFTHRNLKFIDLPPSLLAALEKSEAFYQGLLKDRERLSTDVAELCELKSEADELFEALQARIQPWINEAALAAASPTSTPAPSSTSRRASPHSDSFVLPEDSASARVVDSSVIEISDEEYLTRRGTNSLGKRRAMPPSSLKRRASSASLPAAKKPRIED